MTPHRADAYARAVLDGAIVAGPYVRLAAARHVRDRADDAAAFVFDATAADHAIGFIERWVCLPDTTDDATGGPRRFLLEPWQAFIVASIFGWRWRTSGYRRFRNAYIEVGKGNGKTPLLASIGLYGLMMDGQRAPEIYAAASARDQAMIMFRDAVRMVRASPELQRRITTSGVEQVYNLAYGMGFFRPFSREQGARSGTRPHMGLIDEVHEHRDADICNKIRAGAKGNPEALFAEITNSGYDRASVCWQHHEHSTRILERLVDDDRWFAYVCALDAGDDPLTDRTCHLKTNPNLGVSIQQTYLDDQVDAARHIPAETNTVLRLNFCIWTQAHSEAWPMAAWHASGAIAVDEAALVGAHCYGGLDLGQTDDFAAWVRLWALRSGELVVKARFWLPRAALVKYPHRPYAEWERAGALTVTDGDTTDIDQIEDTVLADCRASSVRELAYDKRFAQQLALHLQGAGITVVDTPQGFGLNESVQSIAKAIADGLVRHGNHPVLTFHMANAVLRVGRNQEVRLDKESAQDKIDGAVALTMANARRIAQPPAPKYQIYVFG
jgi:phage terminase large subunit-like protein